MAYEFPTLHDHHNDLDWLILYYKKLTNEYEILLEKVEKLEAAYENIDPTINAAIDRMKQEIAAALASIRAEVNALMSQVQVDFAALQKEVRDKLADFFTLIVQMENIVSKIRPELKGYTDLQVGILRQEMYQLFKEWHERETLWNPLYQTVSESRIAMEDSFQSLSFAISVGRLDAMGITAGELADLNIPAVEWDAHGRLYIWYWWWMKNRPDYMRSPYTGEWVDPRQVIMEIIDQHQGTITAQELEDANIDVSDYDAGDFTAYDHDWSRQWFDDLVKGPEGPES